MIHETLPALLLEITMRCNEIMQEYNVCPQQHETEAIQRFIKEMEEIIEKTKII